MKPRIILFCCALLLTACYPEERIWWSPQGDRAVVLAGEQLHLVNSDGGLGPTLSEGDLTKNVLVKMVSWLPDGSGFVCQRTRVLTTWEDARKLVPEDEVASVDKTLASVPSLLRAAIELARHGSTLEEITTAMPMLSKAGFMTALRRAYLEDPSKVEPLLNVLPKGGEIIDSLKGKDGGFEVQELCVIRILNGRATEATPIISSLLRPPVLPRVSPKHSALAFARMEDDDKAASLQIVSLDGGSLLTIAHSVTRAFEWTPDGRGIVFMAPLGDDAERLLTLHRVTVLQVDGSLMKPRPERSPGSNVSETIGTDYLQDAATLATVVSFHQPALNVLPDGRILFASQQLSLPALNVDGNQPQSRLFTLSADGRDLQMVPTAPGDLPANLAYFSASPDGRSVAIVEAETDTVAVVTIDTGATEILSRPNPGWQSRTMPAWKSATELTYAALQEGNDTPRCMLWSKDGGARCISEQWPANFTAGWLEKRKDSSTGNSGASGAPPSSKE